MTSQRQKQSFAVLHDHESQQAENVMFNLPSMATRSLLGGAWVDREGGGKQLVSAGEWAP